MRAVLVSIAALLACGAAPAEPSSEILKYAVVRKGEQIGTHTIELQRRDAETYVKIGTQVAVKIGFVTAYRLEQSLSEKWVNGRLVSFRSTTEDGWTHHKVNATAGNDGLRVEADGKTSKAAADTIPTSFWNPALLRQSTALSTFDGSLIRIAVTEQGTEDLVVQGRPTKARRYAIRGDLEQDVWYDERNRLVRARFRAKDSSDIFYDLIENAQRTSTHATPLRS